jgi:hypothetical protein
MKHLKIFEKYSDFNVGDIVTTHKDIDDTFSNRTGCIIIKYKDTYYFSDEKDSFWLKYGEFRLATPEEIYKYELEQNTNKYNL